MKTEFEVNGQPVALDVEPRLSLADCLRRDLHLTGTHVGCEHGVCGACTVLIDGEGRVIERKRRQAELLEENGGREAVIKRGDLGFSPPPGYPVILG